MKNIYKKFFVLIAFSYCLLASLPASAAGLVPCNGPDCKLCHLLVLIVNITNFLMRNIAAPLAGLMFLVGGIMMVAAGGSESRFSKGKEIFLNTLIGVVIVLSSWAIVNTLIMIFGSGQLAGNWWNVQCR